jgi:hypothetical protein
MILFPIFLHDCSVSISVSVTPPVRNVQHLLKNISTREFDNYSIPISAGMPAVLTVALHGLFQSLHSGFHLD